MFFKSKAAFFVSLVTGILIDIDHILDYYIQQQITLRIKTIYLWCIEKRFKLVFLYCHSLELVFILWIAIRLFKLGIFWVALTIGLTQHLVLDIIFNRSIIYPYSYFLSFRIVKRFKKEDLLRKFRYLYLEK